MDTIHKLFASTGFTELHFDALLREQKDAVMEKAKKESALATMEDFAPNLAEFVINRPDLFGTVEDEVCVS